MNLERGEWFIKKAELQGSPAFLLKEKRGALRFFRCRFCRSLFGFHLELGFLGTTGSTEALLKLVDATFGIDKLFLSSEEGMGVRGDTHRDDEVFDAVNFFGFV